MLKLKSGFECQNAGWIRYITPTGGAFRDRIVSWGGRDTFLIMGESLIAHAEHARDATPEDAHALIVEYGPAYGIESPWIDEAVMPEPVTALDEFQALAMRTAGDNKDDRWLAEKMLGLAEECGEVTGLVKKSEYHGRATDRDALRKELGDVMWYVAAIAHWYGFSLSEIATANIEKLRKRYPEGFSVERSLNRGDE